MTKLCLDAYAPVSNGATSVSCVEMIYTRSIVIPVVSEAICEKTVSAPCPISVALSSTCIDPSWFRIMRALEVSSEIG